MMSKERIKLGYATNDIPEYVYLAYSNENVQQQVQKLINDADVVIAGAAPEAYFMERMRLGKLVLRYSERPFKKKPSYFRKLYHMYSFYVSRYWYG